MKTDQEYQDNLLNSSYADIETISEALNTIREFRYQIGKRQIKLSEEKEDKIDSCIRDLMDTLQDQLIISDRTVRDIIGV